MPNLHDQLRRYGGYLDELPAPARASAPEQVPDGMPDRIAVARRGFPGNATPRPRLALAFASVVGLVAALGVVLAVTRGADPGDVQATRTKDAPESTTTDRSAPAGAAPTQDRSLSTEALPGAVPDPMPDAGRRAAVEQQLRAALGPCPTVARAKEVTRVVTARELGAASGVRVDRGSSGPCARLVRVDWDQRIVHLERVGSTP
jgi:hypothetical protein